MDYSVGIIGGADGPTAVFVTGIPVPAILGLAALVIVVILVVRFFRKKK